MKLKENSIRWKHREEWKLMKRVNIQVKLNEFGMFKAAIKSYEFTTYVEMKMYNIKQ